MRSRLYNNSADIFTGPLMMQQKKKCSSFDARISCQMPSSIVEKALVTEASKIMKHLLGENDLASLTRVKMPVFLSCPWKGKYTSGMNWRCLLCPRGRNHIKGTDAPHFNIYLLQFIFFLSLGKKSLFMESRRKNALLHLRVVMLPCWAKVGSHSFGFPTLALEVLSNKKIEFIFDQTSPRNWL